MKSDKARLAVITGASSGIGAAFADRLAADGFDLLLIARRQQRLEEKAATLGQRHGVAVDILVADLTDPAELQLAQDKITNAGNLAMLVNNAGVGGLGPFADMSLDAIHTMITLNITSHTLLTHAALPGMLAAGEGTIINIASGAAFMSMAGATVYSASKAYIAQFTRSLHEEVGSSGIRLQALVPGLVRTEFAPKDIGDAFYDQFPQEMVMAPADLVNASMKGLALGELMCIPSLESSQTWQEAEALLQEIGASSRSLPASRYR